MVWVLERAYAMSDVDIAAAIELLLQSDVLPVENEREVFTAMVALKEHRASFADALIGALGARAGCIHTVTFDKRAARLDGFGLL
jgi:predicted nucleic-acid-binding protein